MAARPLTEAVQQAEEALNDGNYRSAVDTCRRVLGQFPEFATAHRVLGEALLEDDDIAGAEHAFADVLQRDPQSSAAYAGLSKIAESRGDQDSALAYAQVAWENAPRQSDLRDRVATLSEQLYGQGGRLHLTRAALTSLHFQAGRWSRAAAEAAGVLTEHPNRVDVQLRQAEALWRRGSLASAGNACRSVLATSPSSVLALLMLADVERQQNQPEAAAEHLEQARKIDPDGVRAADLVTIGSPDLAEFILPTTLPVFNDVAETTIEAERPRIAPAPDFSWSAADVPQAPDETAATEASAADTSEAFADYDVSLPDDAEIEAARPPAQAASGYTSMLRSLEGEGLQPFHLGGESEDTSLDAFEMTDEATTDDETFGLVSDEELEAARPPSESPRGYTTLLNSLDDTGLEPFQVDDAGSEAVTDELNEQPAAAETGTVAELDDASTTDMIDEFGVVASADSAEASESADTGDLSTALTAGWDDIDAEIERAIPKADSWRGYTGQLRDLDEAGLKPFSIEGVDDDAEETGLAAEAGDTLDDLSFLSDVGLESAGAAQVESNPMDADLTEGWSAVDDEIQNAIPSDSATDDEVLDGFDLSGVEPFALDDDQAGTEQAIDTYDSATTSARDVVPSDLVADIDLWTFEDQPSVVHEAAPNSASIDDIFGEGESDLAIEDLDLSELEMLDSAPEAAEETTASDDEFEPFDLSALEGSGDGGETVLSETDLDDLGAAEPVSEETADLAASVEAAPVFEMTTEPGAFSGDSEAPQPAHAVEVAASGGVQMTIEHLGVDASLFERVRQAKMQRIEAGELQGNQLLPGVEPPGPTLEELEQHVAENPDDVEARRQFATALVGAEDHGRALAEYRAMHTSRMPFEADDLESLVRVAEQPEHSVAGNQLLGAIHRRSGNLGLSAKHYRDALAAHRDNAKKEA
ncbi:MAG TPA: tetratricopeptide repeat protein [Nitrolancea sp.]